MNRYTFGEILLSMLVMLAVAGGFYAVTHPSGCGLDGSCGLWAPE